MVAWSTRHFADEFRAPGMLLALDAVWRDVDAPAVYEAWTLLRDGKEQALATILLRWVPLSCVDCGA